MARRLLEDAMLEAFDWPWPCCSSDCCSPVSTCLRRKPSGASRDRAAKTDRLTLDLYLDMETVSEPQLSPDGNQIVYTRGWIDKMNDKRESALWIMNADGSRNRFLVKGSGARWSPDGRPHRLHRARASRSGTQIFVRWMDAEGATSQVTRRRRRRRRHRVVARRQVDRRSRCSSRSATSGRSRCRRRRRAPSGPRRRASSSS